MTTTAPPAVAPSPSAARTPAGHARSRRLATWAVIVAILVAAGVAAAVFSAIGQFTRRDAMDPASTSPDGTRALARILDTHGVQVHIVRDPRALEDALAAAGGRPGRPADTTLVLPDSPLVSDARLDALAGAAVDVVSLQPHARMLRQLFAAAPTGYGTGEAVPPRCAVPAARRAGAIRPGALFTVPTSPHTAACYRTGGHAALLQRPLAGTTSVAVDGSALFTNAHLGHGGNAALAVNLLGAHDTVVWYVPSQPDGAIAAPTLGELTPAWVSPVIVLLLVAGLAAALWKGRRFGPLVAETLPVTVRASETTAGRARLYARSHDAAHAAGLLRARTVHRLAAVLHQGSDARPGDVADAAADVLGIPRSRARDVLAGTAPTSDRELAALAARLEDLQRAVDAALRPPSEG